MATTDFRASVACTVCGAAAAAFDVVDFNKSCEEVRHKYLPLSGEAIYYHRCPQCGFCFAPTMCDWPKQRFAEKIYNDGYADVDPDYLAIRPQANAAFLLSSFARFGRRRHLDYGGGNGLLSRTLREAGWQSQSYDPFVDDETELQALGSFDLISAFEVFEHVPDIHAVLSEVLPLLRDEAALIFSTTMSDGAIVPGRRLDWWYAAPRNGHVALHSRASLQTLAADYGLRLVSLSTWLHLFLQPSVPEWAVPLTAEAQAA